MGGRRRPMIGLQRLHRPRRTGCRILGSTLRTIVFAHLLAPSLALSAALPAVATKCQKAIVANAVRGIAGELTTCDDCIQGVFKCLQENGPAAECLTKTAANCKTDFLKLTTNTTKLAQT